VPTTQTESETAKPHKQRVFQHYPRKADLRIFTASLLRDSRLEITISYMDKSEAQFGYYPYPLKIAVGDIVISTLDGLDGCVEDIKSDPDIEDGWLYPGRQLISNFGGNVRERPYNARVFGMPKTHLMFHANSDSEKHLDFHIWCLSFILGTQLSMSDAGFLDAVSIRPGHLTDFKIPNPSLEKAVSDIEVFWANHKRNPKIVTRVCAIINSVFMSQYPHHLDFEEFNLLYMGLDTCSAITREVYPPTKKRVTHGERIDDMCKIYGIITPDWAKPKPRKTEISIIRNDTLHEAIFFGEALGYALYDNQTRGAQYRNVLLEMRALTCRILVAILFGVSNSYTSSPTGTRMNYKLVL